MMKTILSLSLTTKSFLVGSLLSSLLVLGGCGSGSSESKVTTNPRPVNNGTGDGQFIYKGEKPAATSEVLKFQTEIWVKIATKDKCGSCHTTQVPDFTREDDINLAYEAVINHNLLNAQKPSDSRLVTKVAGGHNCWVGDASVCADIITGWITAWAGDRATEANTIELEAPADRDIASSKAFPADPGLFSTTVYPIVQEHCSRCHSESSSTRQQPYFASDDIGVAYEAAKSKIRLDNPQASRLVLRLTADSHNCWGECSANGAELAAAIAALAAGIPDVEVDPDLVVSKAVSLEDAFVLTSGGRIDSEVIAKYEFKTGRGSTAYDNSGSGIDLQIFGNVTWSSAWGVKINGSGRLQATTDNSRKMFYEIMGTGEYSIEAWVIPDNVDQGMNDNNPASIVSYNNQEGRNFTLGQYEYNYSYLNRTDRSDLDGLDEIHTPDDDQVLQATLQHVVATFSPLDGRKIYVNGELIDIDDEDRGAVLRDWDPSAAFALGNLAGGGANSQWQGSIRFVAMHKRALSVDDIQKNFEVGVGARYLLLFNISELIDLAGSYIVFEVQQLDDYGYLFASPFFTNLNDAAPSSPVPIRGIRIGVNGAEAPIGQAFANLNTTIEANKIVEERQLLSQVGAIVEAKLGPQGDVFFLTFDQIGSNQYARVEVNPPPPAPPAVIPDQATIGVRNFAEINATLAGLTGVSPNAIKVKETYAKVEQQLPTSPAANGFLASHQMGVTQLAVAYCSELVSNENLRQTFFQGFNFDAAPATAFSTTGRNQVIEPLLEKLLASQVGNTSGGPTTKLVNQAEPTELINELNSLIDITSQSACKNNSSCNKTEKAVVAACASTFSSAVMLLQ